MIFDPDMTSVKPYFIQALHEWISDNDLTPLAVVDASFTGIRVPEGIVEDGKIVLNISYQATENLQMDDELLTFNARFSGVSNVIVIPMEAVSAVYARENGKGMMFDVEHGGFDDREQPIGESQQANTSENNKNTTKSNPKSHLKLVD